MTLLWLCRLSPSFTPNVGFIDFRAHGPRAYGPVKIAPRRGQKVVTTSTCARIGVLTCCEHVEPHTTSATAKRTGDV